MVCNKDCEKCKQLNIKVDDKGYPWGDTKEFENYKAK